ncbi:MAG: BamA/TamA family outer membrane protein, partial [Thermodesulfobacteriota bacterium]
DNYMNPTRGGKHSVTIENTGGLLGGDVAFTKYTGETGWYQPLLWEFVGFAHAKGGYVHENSGGFLPDYDRFYLGGINSLRGFGWHDISVIKKVLVQEEDGWKEQIIEEKGGDKFVQFNIELLCPLFDKKAGLVGLLFYDAGNVYDEGQSAFSLRLRESAGFGIRWFSPMGPIRLERGYILDPKPGEETNGRWEFTIGTAF